MHPLVPLFGALLAVAVPAQDPGIDWLTDLAGARARAQRTGKPMLVVFRCEP